MELTLLNYEDKKTVISYDMQNNEYWKIFYNTERKGFYDIFGVIVLNQTTWMFVETNIFRLTDISKIENNITSEITSLFVKTRLGNEYHLVTTIDLKSDYVFESDYYVDGTEYNLGLYIEKLKRETASEELFIENVLANGLIIQ